MRDPRLLSITLMSLIVSALGLARPTAHTALAAERAAPRMTYGQARDFLVKYTKVIELTNEDGGRVAICPEYQGRVMTSTCEGFDGQSLGWINRAFIERGENNTHFNNYGGEDRFWLAPEGGQYSLWFAPGAKQTLANWLTPSDLNEGAFQVTSDDKSPFYGLARKMHLSNATGTQFTVDVSREIHILSALNFGELFGQEAKSAVTAGALKLVGFKSVNTITNRGAPMTKEKGLFSIWSLGMFPPGPRTKIIIPYKPGSEPEMGPVVKSDYFGDVPASRLRVTDDAIWFTGDGQFRSKIGVSQHRVKPVAGSIDPDAGILTLVHFTMPDDPTAYAYLNNGWELPQRQPYVGDVINSYNDGPPEPGKPSLGGFYELESLSPGAQLPTGKSLSHVHSTFHIQGSLPALVQVAKAALGINIPGPAQAPLVRGKNDEARTQ